MIVGIDPGKNGAIVCVDRNSTLGWYEKLKFDDNGILQNKFGQKYHGVKKIVCEIPVPRGSMGQSQYKGKDSVFWGAKVNYGMGFYFGQLLTRIIDSKIDYELIRPTEWTKKIHSGLKGSGKEKSLSYYNNFFPHKPIPQRKNCSPHDGVVDALLIATYAVMSEGYGINTWKLTRCESWKV